MHYKHFGANKFNTLTRNDTGRFPVTCLNSKMTGSPRDFLIFYANSI